MVLASGCGVDLAVPPGVEVQCGAGGECPSGARCNAITGLCEFNVGVAAPSTAFVQIGPASGRAAALVHVELDALDSNAPPVGDETVRFKLAYSSDGGTWCEATLIDGGVTVVRAEATRVTLTWDALADAAAGSCGLRAAAIPSGPEDGAGTTSVLAYTSGVRLRLTAEDSGSPVSRSEVISPAFALGNDAPLLTVIDDGAVLRQASPFEYTLVDSSLDESRIEAQFRFEGPTPSPWYSAQVRGSTLGVVADALGAPSNRLLVWNADAPLPSAAGAAGGIGHVNADVSLRVRAIESVFADQPTYGAWSVMTAHVFNQTPPVVGAVEVIKVENGAATSLVFVSYEVIDAEGDDVDVRVERSIAGTDGWLPASAYPSIQHSGVRDLTTDVVSPPRHTFVWDLGADFSRRTSQVMLRLTAADDGGAGVPAVVAVPFDVGATVSPAVAYPVVAASAYTAGTSRFGAMLATGDFNGDGLIDYATWASGSFRMYRGIAGGGIGTLTTGGISSTDTRDLAVADVNGDGRDDLVARNEDYIQVALGSAGGLVFGTPVTQSNSLHVMVELGDVDGNGAIDLVFNDYTSIHFQPGDGNGGFGASQVFAAGGTVHAMAVGDFNGDGRADVAYAIQTGQGNGDIIRFVPIELRVRFGVQTGSPPLESGYDVVATGVSTDEDGNGLTHSAALASDVDGDGRAELLLLDMQQSNTSHVRVFSRGDTWVQDDDLRDLGEAYGLVTHKGSPGLIALTNKDFAQGIGWDVAFNRLTKLTEVLVNPANDFAFADLDGDGNRDLMVANAASLQWRPAREPKGIPPDSFDFTEELVIPEGNVTLEVADADGDGLADVLALDSARVSMHVAAAYRSDSLRDVPNGALSSHGLPTFTVPNGTQFGSPIGGAGLGDFDGDGLADVVISNYDGASFALSFGVAPFSYGAPLNRSPGAGVFGGPAYIADFDGDGRDDLFNDDRARAFYARSARDAQNMAPWQVADVTLSGVSRFNMGDVDADGVEDLIGIGTQLSTYFGNTSTGLGAACNTTLGGATGTSVVIGDIDGDGRDDIVASTAANGIMVWSVSRPCAYSARTGSSAPALNGMQLVDVDADGILDIVGWVHTGVRDIYVLAGLENDGRPSGTFGPPMRVTTLGAIDAQGDLGWGDTNRDGLPDLFASSWTTLELHRGRRFHAMRPWTAKLDGSHLVGPVPGADRFGDAWSTAIVARRTTDRLTTIAAARDARSGFTSRLRQSGQSLPAAARAASFAWWFEGHLASDAVGGGDARRVHVRPAPAIDGREVIVDLPLYGDATTDVAKLLVYGRLLDAYDASNGVAPVLADGRTVLRPLVTWTAIAADADGDLMTGTGPRFIVDAPNRRLRIATDRLGVMRAYATP